MGAVVALLAAAVMVAPPASAAPVNDTFAQAQLVSGWSFEAGGSSVGATSEPGEPSHDGRPAGASIWYSWTAPGDGQLSLDSWMDDGAETGGVDYSHTLAVYTGATLSALAPVTASTAVSNSLSLSVVAGQTYRIAVNGADGAAGATYLHGFAVVGNNDFASPVQVAGSAGEVQGANTNADKEKGEPSHAGNDGGSSVWFRWTAPASGSSTLTTAGSSFDTLLGVYTGTAVNGLSSVVADDDCADAMTSCVTFTAVAGTVYDVAVDGYFAEQGSVRLSWSQDAAPATGVPGPPTGVAASVSGTSATLSWSPPSSAGGSAVTGYRVARDAGSAGGSAYATSVAASTRSLTFLKLVAGSTYTLSVSAVNGQGTGAVSTLSVTVPAASVPAAPAIGTAAAGTTGGAVTATARWTAPTSTGGSAITGYRVRGLRMSASGALLGTTTSALQSATARSLSMTLPQTGNYRFTVEAVNAVGAGAQSARSNLVAGR